MADILSYSLRSTFAKEFYQSLTDPVSDDRYYMAFGRAKPWDGDTPTTVDTIQEQNELKRNTLFYQRILPSDVCLMVPRYDWSSGTVYDQYEDDVELWADSKQYYVLTQNGDQYNVYLCLSNNSGVASTDPPTGQDTEEVITTDGYIWKYLYTLTQELEEFLTLSYMPVVILDKLSYTDERALALNVKANAISGSIEKITVDTVGDFSNLYLVNTQLTSSYTVSTVGGDGLSFTAALTPDHNSSNNYYDTNYVVYFDTGKIGTIDTYTISGNTVTITLCELYPDDGEGITTGDKYSILPKVKVTGNGTGAVAVPVFDSQDVLTEINVINGGQDYNFAESFFLVNSGSVIATVIPPKGGHGYDAVNELKPTHILIKKDTDFAAIPDDQEKYFGAGGFIRQLGIVRNITTNNGTNPDEQVDEYDMMLKFDGYVVGTNYYAEDDPFALPYFRTICVTSVNLTQLAFWNAFSVGDECRTVDTSNPPKQWQGIVTQKGIEESYRYLVFSQKSLSGRISDNPVNIVNVTKNITVPIPSSGSFGSHTNFFNLDIPNLTTLDLFLSLSNFDNNIGKIISAFSAQYPETGVFFDVGDEIELVDGEENIGLRMTITEIIRPGFNSALPFTGAQLPEGISSTTFKGNCSIFNIPTAQEYATTDNILQYRFLKNISKNTQIDLLAQDNIFFSNPRILVYLKDKVGVEKFNSSDISFSDPQTAPVTAPTHIMGNDTLSVATINSLSVDTTDNTKFNLKISTPTDDFEPAVIQDNEVISGESVTLLRGTPTTNFTRSFEKIGNTDLLYVLSENFDVNNPANTPTTITSSVVSKLQVKRTGDTTLNNSIIPVGSYLYRESTTTTDSAAGYVVAIDDKVVDGSDATMFIYVQMEKGSFELDDTIKCVEDAFTKDITLFSGTCAGNAGVTITISETEQRYNNIFLNKYSGEVLYIQNTTNPIQMATDTQFTTRILLGF